MICPRCDKQGLLYNAKVLDIDKTITICDECDACWSADSDFTVYNFTDLTLWLENNNLTYEECDIKDLGYLELDSESLERAFFDVSDDKIIQLIDEAWVAKGESLADDAGVYVINMNKAIGTKGETGIKIIVKPGTSEIKTVYPIMIENK